MKSTGLSLLPAVPLGGAGAHVSMPPHKLRLVIDTDGPARLEVRGSGSETYQPADAVMDHTMGLKHAGPYAGHFTSPGWATLELEPGNYTIIAEKGLEFTRVESTLELSADQTIRLTPKRWIHMVPKGWWSADFHVHRPPEHAKLLISAEDINLGVFFTMWNKQSYWKDRPLPADPTLAADSRHIATLMNEEDERGGGAWMMHNLKQPIDLSAAQRWSPQGHVFVDGARRQGAWFDSEKPIWWEAPVMAALCDFDSMGVVHNHYHQYGMMANEAWGRPRDQKLFPGMDGFSNYSQGLYHRYLNLGKRYPASAGAASGVLPAPPGYSRVYVYAPGALSVSRFYAAMKAGRTFATNGPILSFTVNGKRPGETVAAQPHSLVHVVCEAQAREPIKAIEIIANGEVVSSSTSPKLEATLDPSGHTWMAARCTLATTQTVRLAHTSPVFLTGERQVWDSSPDRIYFRDWIDDLIEVTKADPKRFASTDQMNEILAIYRQARKQYES